MIKCPNCGSKNMDGTLFCEDCIWDLSGVPSTPDDAAPMAADEPPIALIPGKSMLADDVEVGDIPMARPVSMLADPLPEARPPTMLPAGTGLAKPATNLGKAPTNLGKAPTNLGAPPAKAPTNLGGTNLAKPATNLGAPLAKAPTNLGGAPPAKAPTNLGGAPPAKAPTNLGSAPPAKAPTNLAGAPVRFSTLANPPRLVVVRGQKAKKEYPLYDGQNFIGRFSDTPVDIDLTELEATDKVWGSRQHAMVSWVNGDLFIEDMKSANGTFVNRNRLAPGEKLPLKNGDYIQTGTVLFQVKC